MVKSVAIIGLDNNIIEKTNQIMKSRKYFVKYIILEKLDFEILDEVNYIYIDDRMPYSLKTQVLEYALSNKKKLYVIPWFFSIGQSIKYNNINDLLSFKIEFNKISLVKRLIKRILDFFISLTAIILLSFVMIIISILIKIFDHGPVLYLQKRITYQKKEFIIFKFRTMVVGAEKNGIKLSTYNDNRITKIGHFLRKTRLDEIPQFFNVLIGDMSIVGPRPERKHYVSIFTKEDQFYKYRYLTKAGITGLSQINCRYNSNYQDKLKYDLLYISRFSLKVDLLIILKTIKILFKKDAAEGIYEENIYDLIVKKNVWIWEKDPYVLELIQK